VVAMLERRFERLIRCLGETHLSGTREHSAYIAGRFAECAELIRDIQRGDHRAPATGKEKGE
jgi:hypothetical protein